MSWKIWRGTELKKRMHSGLSNAVYDTTEEVGVVSDQEVPMDEATLLKSKTILKNPANDLETFIGYGGGGSSGFPRIPYAIKWHETPANFQHGRKHNYLRDPVNTIAPVALRKNIKAEMIEVLR